MSMQESATKETASCIDIAPGATGERPSHGIIQRNIALVYSLFFLVDPIQRNMRLNWILLAVVYPIFLALYLSIPHLRGRRRTAALAALFVLPFLYMPFNNSASGMFCYAMGTLPFLTKDARRVISLLVLQIALILTEGLVLRLSPWNFGMAIFFTLVVTFSNLYFAQKLMADAKLHMAQDEIERLAKTAERERIARDLHDVLGHTLTLVVLKSQVAERLITTDPAKAADEVREIQNTARKALAEVREAVLGFRLHGLAAEMENAGEALRSAGIAYEHSMHPKTLSALLTREQEMALTLGVREDVTNIVRHSSATRCSLRLGLEDTTVQMIVVDDGCGGDGEGGYGLKGMRERVEMLGGKLILNGASGMHLTLQMPLEVKA